MVESSRTPEQGALFEDPMPAPDEQLGYRGPTACAAAGITYRQLDYWARTDLVVPTVRSATGSGTQRLYSFKDILVLKVVKRLLDTGVSLHNIRRAVDALRSPRCRRSGADHAAVRRHHRLRVHLGRRDRRSAARRPGRVRHRRQRRTARADRRPGRICRASGPTATLAGIGPDVAEAVAAAADELARRRERRSATA